VNLSIAQLPAHTHTATFNQTGSSPITVNIPVSTGVGTKLAPDATNNYMAGTTPGATGANMWTNQAGQTAPVNVGGVTTSGGSVGTVTNANTGGNAPVATIPPQLGMMQCIVTQGLYPPRPN
jgi:microcystin-dependent protein